MTRVHVVVCHGCGRVHEKAAEFLSTPLSLGCDVNGQRWVVGAIGCPECLATPGVIRAAFDNGTSPEAFARFQREWAARVAAGTTQVSQ